MNRIVMRIIVACNLALAIVALLGTISAVVSQRAEDFIVGCAVVWTATLLTLAVYAVTVTLEDK